MALQGFNALIKLQSSAVAFTDEEVTTSDNQTYQITTTSKRIWDLNTAVVVKDDTTVTTEDYAVTYLTGTIEFDSVDAERVITVSGGYVTPATVATGKSFSFSGTSDALENTPFGSEYREYQAGLVTGTGEISRFFVADDLFIDMLLDGTYKIIEFYPDSSGDPIQFYGIITSESIEAPVDGLIEESISFQITKEMGI